MHSSGSTGGDLAGKDEPSVQADMETEGKEQTEWSFFTFPRPVFGDLKPAEQRLVLSSWPLTDISGVLWGVWSENH